MKDAGDPIYVNRWGRVGGAPPLLAYGAQMYGFVFRGSAAALHSLCDRYLNIDPSQRIVYEPFSDHVLLTFTSVDWLKSANRGLGQKFGTSEYELAVWVVVRRRGTLQPILYTPYILLDNPPAIQYGREVWGFPKEAAEFDKEAWGKGERFRVKAWAVEQFSPTANLTLRNLLTVERTSAAEATRIPATTLGEVAAHLQHELLTQKWVEAALRETAAAVERLWPPHGPLIFLKQFPVATAESGACYQNLIEADLDVTALYDFQLLGDQYVLHLEHCSSHPLGVDLGLQDGAEAHLPYWVKFDFTLGGGRELLSTTGRLAALPALPSAPNGLAALWQLGKTAARAFLSAPVRTSVGLVKEGPVVFGKRARNTVRTAISETRAKNRKQQIAILGGGVGAMAAAFALTSTEGWQGRYEVTVYQIGWRLGGKGASGRNLQSHARIEEHGLHVWFGFYHNAFAMMRQCYAELTGDRNAWKTAFKPHDYVVLEDKTGGDWQRWPLIFPPRPGALLTPWEYTLRVLDWLRDIIRQSGVPHPPADAAVDSAPAAWWHSLKERLSRPTRLLPYHPGHFLDTALLLAHSLGRDPHAHSAADHSWLAALLGGYRDWFEHQIDSAAHEVLILLDLGCALVRGMLKDGVLLRGFDAIDDRDLTEWLRSHGASRRATESAYVRGLHSLGFAFLDGDNSKPNIGAGTMLRVLLRMLLAYDGEFMWKMQAGMGDIVFAPLYEVLKQRGVHFEFFHRVRSLHVSDDKQSIERIVIGRQARPKQGSYNPLVPIKQWMCWPNEPDFSQLIEGAELETLKRDPAAYVDLESSWSSWGPARETEVTLQRGEHFDMVVLGISLGALKDICGDLIDANAGWRRMIESVKTVRTQSCQLWLSPSLNQLGWPNPGPISTAYEAPIDTWAEMNQLLAAENWPDSSAPQLVAYLCGAMREPASPPPAPYSDPTYPARNTDMVRVEVDRFLATRVQHLWPQFDPSMIIERFHRANIDPSERYVLSVAGTLDARLPSDQSGFRNLYLAGDWTRNGINAGCVEAAVISGMQAARAISGSPQQIIGETDFG